MHLLRVFVALLTTATLILAAGAQQYPNRPVTLVVPYPPGGLSDVAARAVAQELTKQLGVSFVVENRVGASGTIGAAYVARSAADGYTLLVNAVADVTNLYYMTLPYNVQTDFAPIGMIVEGPPLILIVNPSIPYKSVSELINGARAQPGTLSFGSSGPGTSPSIAISQLKSVGRIDIVDVPYRGVAQAAVAVVSGEIAAAFVFQGSARPLAKDGKVRALASTSAQRGSSWPDLPTMMESGFPGFEFQGFVGLAAPAGTPQSIITLLNQHLNAIVREPSFQERFASNGMQPREKNSPLDFAEYISREVEKNRELAKLTQQNATR